VDVCACAPLDHPALSEDDARRLERTFKALADVNRVRILNALLIADAEETCVCDFEGMLGLGQSTVSYHLKQLVDAGLVERRRRGTYSHYRVIPGALDGLSAVLGPR
jgi:ArsR family transcriptional regulator, arsenate/arsenite/antimonite-responsive transcriptional repressor